MRFLQATRRVFAEPHPHARNPVSMAPHRLDTAQHIRMAIKAGATYVDIKYFCFLSMTHFITALSQLWPSCLVGL